MISPNTTTDSASAGDGWLFANHADVTNSRVGPDEAAWPLRYRLLAEEDASSKFRSLANAQSQSVSGQRVDSVSFQPCAAYESQDRHAVRSLDIHGKVWTLTAIFDGHVGTSTAEYAAEKLPLVIQDALCSALGPDASIEPSAISVLLSEAVTSFDQAMIDDVMALFPSGIDELSDDGIKLIINDGGINYAKVRLLCHGSTALVSLVDPDHTHLWVANLGDCEAVLVSESVAGEVSTEVLTNAHNGDNPEEVQRQQREHPGEPDCAMRDRVLGLIAVFRALGDAVVKLPLPYVQRVLRHLDPVPFTFPEKLEPIKTRSLTPPYMSNIPEVTHRPLAPAPGTCSRLLMYSDGVMERCYEEERNLPGGGVPWAELAQVMVHGDGGQGSSDADNMALRVLRHIIRADDLHKLSLYLTLEVEAPWFDDITIIAQRLA